MIVKVEDLGTIKASKECLSRIVVAFQNAEELNSRDGENALSKSYKVVWSSIFDQLDAVGYYDKARKELGFK